MAAAKKKATSKTTPKPKNSSGGGDLLAGILAEPDDLELRLVYADSLIEAGDPRGTFIAEQCALSKLDPLDERYAVLLASTQRLEAEHAHAWIGDYAKKTKLAEAERRTRVDRHANAIFENGFLRSIAVMPEQIETHWSALREREPIDGMHLLVGESLDAAYRALEAPKVLTALKVTPESWFTPSSIGNVLAWGMPHLRDLDLSSCDAGRDGCLLLANAPTDLARTFKDFVAPPPFARGQLQRLVLKNCNALDGGARTLFAATDLTGLVELDLSQNKISEAATLTALRDAPAMKSLRRLSLAGNNTLDIGALAGWEALDHLEQLAIPQSTTRAAMAALFRHPSANLRELDLASAKELLKTPDILGSCAEQLTHLDIGTTSIGDAGFREVLAFPTLMHLHANGCSLSDDAVAALVGSKLRRLVTLDLSSNKLSDEALVLLAKWPGLAHVTYLRLGNNRKLGKAGYQAIIDAPTFRPAVLDVGKTTEAAALRERFGTAVRAQ